MSTIVAALGRSRSAVFAIAAVYALSVTAGALMVHSNNRLALNVRDSIVARAHRADPASRADDAGRHAAAAAIDFTRNLFLGAVPDTIGGLTIVLPFGTATYRGWVGGIVSVDRAHRSRFRTGRAATYYMVTLLLQLAGFSLAGGAGVRIGWAFFRRERPLVGPAWFALPKRALDDAARLYLLAVPLFAIGSWWEFLGPAA